MTISVYNSNDVRDASARFARDFGFFIVVGDRWTFDAGSETMAARVEKALGGKLA